MNKVITSALLLSLLLLSGCAILEPAPTEEATATSRGSAASASVQRQPAAAEQAAEAAEESGGAELPPLEPILFPGTDNMVNLPEDREPIQLDGDAVTLNFEEAPLLDVVHAILGDTLELDYVIDGMLGGQVTLRTRSPVPRDQLLPILESLLQSNGAVMVRDPNDRYFVSSSPSLGTLLPGFSGPGSQGAGYSNVIVPLNYISASAMADILRPVAPEEAFVRIDGRRNLLVLAGTRNQISGWMDIVSTFDVDQLSGMSVGIFPLDNTSVDDIEAALGQLLGSQSGRGNSEGGEGSEGAGTTAAVGPIRVMPLEELNSILVVSPRAHYIDQVRTWIERLDQVQAGTGEAALYVYPVQNGNAVQLAELLSQVFGGSTSSGSRSENAQDSGVAPGLNRMNSGSGSADMPDTGSNRQSGGANFEIGDNIRVVADTVNNSLLIYAPRKEYNKIADALQQLDIVPAQVLIEASIIEVTLTDDLEFGLEWQFRGNLGSDYDGTGTLNLNGSRNIGPRVPGFSYSVTNNAGDMRAVINALAERSLVNVLSTPSILVLDNHTAAIHVGDQQPIQGATIITDGGNRTNSIEYKDTGVQLEVTPTVNAGDLVTMDILQSVTDVGQQDSATGQRAFMERNISSRVAIRTGESVVLGGLIRDNSSRARSGLPFLQDIPILGHLFGGTVNTSSRTELLVFITPRVLRTEQDLRDISREMRTRMQGLEHFEDLPINIGNEESTE